jgi:glutamate N-acetyltransferase/amino-acid N-acetyltransferase
MNSTASQDTMHLPKGFSFSAVTAGIKASGRPDLALAEAGPGTSAAAVFTKNLVVAAPVLVGRAALAATRGHVRAVLVNSGNANCATGKAGIQSCKKVCREAARHLHAHTDEVFPSSTGIIGVPLPADKITAKLPDLIAARQATVEGLRQFARAILTTDTRIKVASTRFRTKQGEVTLAGTAKGSGMIHPQLATMLVYVFTDVAAGAGELRSMLRQACDQTFNCISVDGDTSTNDTVLLMASGQSGVRLKDARAKFGSALLEVCSALANKIVSDGEGVHHVITLSVEQAKTREEALKVARAVAHSLLVKTAWAGADPNWGRILAAVGSSGVPIRPDQVEIAIGDQIVFRRGEPHPFDEARAHQHLAQPNCEICIRLRRGPSSARFYTTDLTAEYVHINADYST